MTKTKEPSQQRDGSRLPLPAGMCFERTIAEGGYGDLADGQIEMGTSSGALEWLYKQSIAISYRMLIGNSIDTLSPLDVIDQIAPRPILLIYGTEEPSLDGAKKQQAAAGDNAQLWIVQGSGHGDYLETEPEEFERRVITFLDEALAPRE